ncbi:MAG: hypothetical protein ACREUE_01030, partial [Panacagrimonas sp.]
RLQCSFAVARRSFRADVAEADIADAITAVRRCHAALLARDAKSVLRDRAELQALLESLRTAPSFRSAAVSS